MREIPLTQGKVALVDDEDFEFLNQFKWYSSRDKKRFYCVCHDSNNHDKTIYIHRIIMNPPENMEIDHIDGNGLDNRRENLRIVTKRENQRNRHVPKTSKYPGVSYDPIRKKWRSTIVINKKCVTLGRFVIEEEAYEKYMKATDSLCNTLT